MGMYCFQCEQTAKGTGCTNVGVCGKQPDVAALQDLLLYATKGIAQYMHRAAQLGVKDASVDLFTIEALFSTVTNVDFDPERLKGLLRKAVEVRDRARVLYEGAARKAGKTVESLSGPAAWTPAADLAVQGASISIVTRKAALGDDVVSLQEVITYGLKGAAAYLDHALVLGQTDEKVLVDVYEILDLLTRSGVTVDQYVAAALKVGAVNLRAMELLDAGNTGTYGHPAPTAVRIDPVKGKAILVSGHDLKDLDELLTQTQGKGVHVYTHGEMLPTHGYPAFKKYAHFVGNYGGAWQDQQKEFAAFPGAILMTTNCIQKPQETYQGRIFTSGLVAWPGVRHIADRNFTPVIEAALQAPGFTEDGPGKKITVGFGRSAVMGVAGVVIDAVKAGKIRHFFLVGGCDGAKSGRNYYTDFARAVPKDCVILTLACGKYRFNKLDFGDIGGIPRLLDIGQCNDAYSAIQIAVALSKAFNCGVNDLPLSLILSWYEQKAVAILLTLLHLGIKNIRIGPSLPAFVSPTVLGVLVKNFNLTPISTPEQDLKAILGK